MKFDLGIFGGKLPINGSDCTVASRGEAGIRSGRLFMRSNFLCGWNTTRQIARPEEATTPRSGTTFRARQQHARVHSRLGQPEDFLPQYPPYVTGPL